MKLLLLLVVVCASTVDARGFGGRQPGSFGKRPGGIPPGFGGKQPGGFGKRPGFGKPTGNRFGGGGFDIGQLPDLGNIDISELCKRAVSCPTDVTIPVCGSDGVTYDNPCELLKVKCDGVNSALSLEHQGECDSEPLDRPTGRPNLGEGRPNGRPNFGGDRPNGRPNFGGDRPNGRPNFGGDRPNGRPNFGGDRPNGRPNFGGDRPNGKPNFEGRPNFGGEQGQRPTGRPNFGGEGRLQTTGGRPNFGGEQGQRPHGYGPQFGGNPSIGRRPDLANVTIDIVCKKSKSCQGHLPHETQVCGTDGETYATICELISVKCETENLELAIDYFGACGEEIKRPQIGRGRPDPEMKKAFCERRYERCHNRTDVVLCGSDNVTYDSECEFKIAKCMDIFLTIAKKGECTEDQGEPEKYCIKCPFDGNHTHTRPNESNPLEGVYMREKRSPGGFGGKPSGNRRGSYGRKQHGKRPEGGRPYGGRPYGGRPEGGRPEGGRPEGGRPEGGIPYGGRPYGGRPEGGRPEGGRPEGGRPEGGRPEGGRPEGGKREGGRPEGGRPLYGGRPEGGRPEGDRPEGGRPDGRRPEGGRPHNGGRQGPHRGGGPGPHNDRRPGPHHRGHRIPKFAVCGTDGITYTSACELKRTACLLRDFDLDIASFGPCATAEPVTEEDLPIIDP